jgi:hypothetical protein
MECHLWNADNELGLRILIVIDLIRDDMTKYRPLIDMQCHRGLGVKIVR